jgi:SAM-dependent methyltransferase/uncharacterized protein YbaR (Trm112 family)
MNGFPRELLSVLNCPCCGSRLEASLRLSESSDGIRDGVLRCDCYEYPVVHGIPVLRQLGHVATTRNGAVECLRKGDIAGALSWLLAAGIAPGVSPPASSNMNSESARFLFRKLRDAIRRKPDPPVAVRILQMEGLEPVLRATRPRDYANYLYHRFANPSFLGAIPPLIVLGDACGRGSRRRLLDLMSGVGHASAMARGLCPEVEVVMADMDFVNLFLARRLLAPDAVALCLDVEMPLPFQDGSFDSVFCLDGLHYVRSKAALLEEVDRAVSPSGSWVFAHMHNAKGANPNAGVPLDARGYMQRFAFGAQRLLPETEVLRQFEDDGSLDLTRQPPLGDLESSDALTVIGARTEDLWTRHSGMDEALLRRPDLIALNPLYQVDPTQDGCVARSAWPSDSLRQECTGTPPLLQEIVHLSSKTLSSIAAARAGAGITDEVRSLIRSFVLVSLPQCYPRADLEAR